MYAMSTMDLRLEYFSKYPRVPLHPIQPSWFQSPTNNDKQDRTSGMLKSTGGLNLPLLSHPLLDLSIL
jgi:hypothetical protein